MRVLRSRCEIALDVLRSGPSTSVQALNEFVSAGRRKFCLKGAELQERFLSEDLQHGRMIDGRLTVRNPFLASA